MMENVKYTSADIDGYIERHVRIFKIDKNKK